MAYDPNDPAGAAPPYEPIPPSTPPPAGYQQPPYQQQPGYPPPAASPGLPTNTAAALCYLTFIPAIIFLVIEPYNKNPFIRFHAFQSIAFSVIAFALHLILGFIPIVGLILSLLLSLVFLVLWIIVILKAAKGEWYKLPVIGDFALSQSRS